MTTNTQAFEALRIFFTGVGGQGTLLATRMVGEAALDAGLSVTMSEIHGMAQRGGVVESSVVIGDAFSPTIPDGEADILMAFEPLEALRAISKCRAGSLIIASTVPVVPFTVAVGQSTYPEVAALHDAIKEKIPNLLWLDAVELAGKAGSERASNTVLVGVLAGIGRLPIPRSSWEEALKRTLPNRLLEINRQAFDAGYEFGAEAA
jgi:indolepyruvate ferredoxin oxidoreductase, beta subunit